MRKEVYDPLGGQRLRVEDAEPECGQDCCDRCGDCLVCYTYDGCFNPDGVWDPGYPHRWVEYEDV